MKLRLESVTALLVAIAPGGERLKQGQAVLENSCALIVGTLAVRAATRREEQCARWWMEINDRRTVLGQLVNQTMVIARKVDAIHNDWYNAGPRVDGVQESQSQVRARVDRAEEFCCVIEPVEMEIALQRRVESRLSSPWMTMEPMAARRGRAV